MEYNELFINNPCTFDELERFISIYNPSETIIISNNLNKNELKISPEGDTSFVSNFAYPVVNERRNEIVAALKEAGVEARPLIAGSMGSQPFWIKKYGKTTLKNCDRIDKYGFYVPNNQNITEQEIQLIAGIINKF